MSYTINVYGHAITEDEEQSRAFEREVLARTREFVVRTPGVTGATFSGGHIGFVDLLRPADETQPAPIDRPAPVPEPEPAPAATERAAEEPAPEATNETTATTTVETTTVETDTETG